jgi:hypothetical protein
VARRRAAGAPGPRSGCDRIASVRGLPALEGANRPLHVSSLLPGLVAAYVALVTHEAGHLLAGRLVGFRFGLLALDQARGRTWLRVAGAAVAVAGVALIRRSWI